MDQRKIDVTPLTNIIIIFADNSQYDLRLTDTYIYIHVLYVIYQCLNFSRAN